MLKLTLFILVTFLLSVNVNAQETEQVKAWQQQHPKVIFISIKAYQNMSPQEREIIEKKEVIHFSGEITMDDIYSFVGASGDKNLSISFDDEAEFVKQWISKNPHVKKVKNSTFQNLIPAQKEEYTECSYCMILSGEEISISDIENFELDKQ